MAVCSISSDSVLDCILNIHYILPLLFHSWSSPTQHHALTYTIQPYGSDGVIKQWDDWVPQDRVRKFTEENKELAAQLHQQMKSLQQRPPKSATKRGGRANGSDFSSARGSEERHVAAQGGRGPRRNRDFDVETVSSKITFLYSALFYLVLCPILSPPCGTA
jgi:hypothetical protein